MSGVLLTGTVLPATEGWTTITNLVGAPDVSSNGTTVRLNSQTDSDSNPIVLFSIDAALEEGTGFALQWVLTVNAADEHNVIDAGVALLPSYGGGIFGTPDQRAQMIYFDTDEIGWADDAESFTVDTTIPHTYRLDVGDDGDATLSVDGTVRLTRSGIEIGGTIAFGDQTNDADVDGDFLMSNLEVICP